MLKMRFEMARHLNKRDTILFKRKMIQVLAAELSHKHLLAQSNTSVAYLIK